MNKNLVKIERRGRRQRGIRSRVIGTPERPRLAVFRSNLHIYAQVIDDMAGRTLVSADSRALGKGSNRQAATEVGKQLAARAIEAGIQNVAFDRGGYLFHGRVKAVAEGAREAGLKF